VLYHAFIKWRQEARLVFKTKLERQHEDFKEYVAFLVSLSDTRSYEQHARSRLNALVACIKSKRMQAASQEQLASALSQRGLNRSQTLAFRLWKAL
jgi:hypothetical protein